MRWLDSVIEATNMNLTQVREAVEDRRAWRALVHWGHEELDMTKQQQRPRWHPAKGYEGTEK